MIRPAWSGALRKRGELDNIPALCDYADNLEKATVSTIESGIMTGDMAALSTIENKRTVYSEEFLSAIADKLAKLMND